MDIDCPKCGYHYPSDYPECTVCFGTGRMAKTKTKKKEWTKEFDKRFTFGGITGVVALKTDNATDVKQFISQTIEQILRERVEEILKLHEPYTVVAEKGRYTATFSLKQFRQLLKSKL